MFIVRNRAECCCIIIPECAEAAELTAARELKAYIEKITGVALSVQNNIVAGEHSVYIGKAAQSVIDTSSLMNDGYEIREKDGNLYIRGNSARGTLYGVYGLLEYFGCKFYAKDTEVIPSLTELEVRDGTLIREIPPFEYRDLYWACTYDENLSAKLRINGALRNQSGLGRTISEEYSNGVEYAGPHFVHTFEMMVPPEKYFDTHPEYFAMIDGERSCKHLYSQLCLTNPDVLDIIIQKTREWLIEYPQAKIVSVSQNDSFVIGSYCTCPECTKINQEEGAPSGSLIRFVNKVAEALEGEFPDVAFDTLAYQYSVQPPKITKPRHNVIVRMCTGGCSSHAIDECENNRGSYDAIIGWGKICKRLYIWDYSTDFAQYLIPFPNLHTLGRNIRFFAANNVKGVFEQGNYHGVRNGEFAELRCYMMAKALWNPECDIEKCKTDFIAEYYGGAAEKITEYLEFIHNKCKDKHFNLVVSAKSLYEGLISDDELTMLDKLWEDAYKAASEGANPERSLMHTRVSGICHEFYKLDSHRGKYADNAEYDALVKKFYESCNELGITRLTEGVDVPWVEV